jgi:hypothetical protein
MIGAPQTARENEILRTLEAVYPKGNRFTLIGGYAVDAYSPLPRYSVDCDMVIPKTELEALGGVLRELGYADGGAQWRDELSGLETRNSFGRPRLGSIAARHELANPAGLCFGNSVNAADCLALHRRHAQQTRVRDYLHN